MICRVSDRCPPCLPKLQSYFVLPSVFVFRLKLCNKVAKLAVSYKDDQEESSLLASGRSAADAYAKTKTIKAALYAIQVFYSFFIM